MESVDKPDKHTKNIDIQTGDTMELSNGSKEAEDKTSEADKDSEKEKSSEIDTVTPEDAEVAEIDDEHLKTSQEKRTTVTFGVSAMEAVREIRFRIEQKTKLTASAGKFSQIFRHFSVRVSLLVTTI